MNLLETLATRVDRRTSVAALVPDEQHPLRLVSAVLGSAAEERVARRICPAIET